MLCALCGNDCGSNPPDSHIIPKLVYRRIRSHPNTRFRNISFPTQIMQDGEAKKMLCSSCEQFFSKYEKYFADKVLDPYLSNESFPNYNMDEDLYIFMVTQAWRVIWDDIFNLNSYSNSNHQDVMVEFEECLKNYLLDIKDGKQVQRPKRIENTIYLLKSLVHENGYVKLISESGVLGYSWYRIPYFGITIQYAGLVFVTSYQPWDMLLWGEGYEGFNDAVAEDIAEAINNLRDNFKAYIESDLYAKVLKRYSKEDNITKDQSDPNG